MLYQGYKIIIEKKAQKYLEKLHASAYKKIVLKISGLVESEQKSLHIKKLQGYKNLYRLRVDDYRVIFAVLSSRKIIVVAVVGHRKEIYNLIKKMPFLSDFK